MDQTEHIHELGESRDMSSVYAERDGREYGEKHFVAEVRLKPNVAGDVGRRRYMYGYEHKNAALAALIIDPSVAEVEALRETDISESWSAYAENKLQLDGEYTGVNGWVRGQLEALRLDGAEEARVVIEELEQ